MKHYELKLYVTEEELQLAFKTLGEILYYKQAKHGYWGKSEEDTSIRWTLTEKDKEKRKVLLQSGNDEKMLNMITMALTMANKKEEE